MTHKDQSFDQPINTAMITMLEACGFQVLRAFAGDPHLVKGTIENAAAFYTLTVAGVDADQAAQRPAPVAEQEPFSKLQRGNEESHKAYELRTIPVGCLVLVMSVDVQCNRLEYKILGFGRNKKHWVIDYNTIEGDPAEEDVWTRLTDLRERPIENSFGISMRVQSCAIESGGLHTDEAYHYANLHRRAGVFAVRGASDGVGVRPIIGRPARQDAGEAIKKEGEVWVVGSNTAKSLLFKYLASDKDSTPEDRLIHFPVGLSDAYFEQLTAEVYDWKSKVYNKLAGGRSEAIDLFVYCFAAAFHPLLDLQAMKDADWALLENLFEPSHASRMQPTSGSTPCGATMLDVGTIFIESDGRQYTKFRWPCQLLGRGEYRLYVEQAQAELYRTRALYLARYEAGEMTSECFHEKMDALHDAVTAQDGKGYTP